MISMESANQQKGIMKSMQQAKNRKVTILTHYYADGPAQALKEYCLRREYDIVFMAHPLFYQGKDKGSFCEIYRQGKLEKSIKLTILKKNSLIDYAIQFLRSIIWGVRYCRGSDVFVGANNLNASAGLAMRYLGVVRKAVYYVVDYTPKRFESKKLNAIYHWVENFCAVNCDETWNLSQRMIQVRQELHMNHRKAYGIQRIVPMGMWFNQMKRYGLGEINRNQIVFMGHILEKQGLQFVIDAVPLIIKRIPDFKFLVIGNGEYLDELKRRVCQLDLNKYITFTGFMEDHRDIEENISRSALAVALYLHGDKESNWTFYSDPGKIKAYLGAGVPVLLTDVPHNAQEIQRARCGKIITLKKEDIATTIIGLLMDEKTLAEYKKNAVMYSSRFDWESMFDDALGSVGL